MTQDTLRGSGRTTRMLQEAIKVANGGKNVTVYGANKNHIKYLWSQTKQLLEKDFKDFKGHFETAVDRIYLPSRSYNLGNIFFCTPQEEYFDWEKWKSKRPDSDIVFVDHYAIEVGLAKAFAEMHRWDEEPSGYIQSLYRETANDGTKTDDFAMERQVRESSKLNG